MLCLFLLYSKVNQFSIYMYPLFFRFSSHIGHYRVLSRVPCAIQEVLTSYLFCMVYICQSQSPNLSLPPTFPLGNHKFAFYICDSISVL